MVKLRIEGEGAVPVGYRVLLDDQDISDATRAVTLRMGVGDVNIVNLEVYADRVDVEAKLECIHVGNERTTFVSRFREWIGA